MAYYNLSQIDEVLSRLDGAYAPNTLKSFYADSRAFVDWCSAENHTAFPLTSNAIRAYVTNTSILLDQATPVVAAQVEQSAKIWR